MAKVKGSKDAGKIPNKAVHSRVSYLYQAATYLATQQQQHSKTTTDEGSDAQRHDGAIMTQTKNPPSFLSEAPPQHTSRRLISDLRAVSLKAQMRMSPAMKHSICKNCDTLLVDGSTRTSHVENKSKGGKKSWADILVQRCNTCGAARRFPLAADRQRRRPQRSINGPENTTKTHATKG